MRFLAVHPGCLMYSEIFLRLEPLGLELVAESARRAGHDVRILDLQVDDPATFRKMVQEWEPEAIAFGCNYLANVPEIVDMARWIRTILPRAFVFVGGHSASFTAREFLEHGDGAIDCILKGEGEAGVVSLLEAAAGGDRSGLETLPGVVTLDGEGPPPVFVANLDDLMPARDLLRRRRKYFIGVLDPCASIEFARGCPWDCSFCSAWTFYGRSYRVVSPERAVEDLARVREPGVFIVDDVAFIQPQHGLAIAEQIARRDIRKKYYLETRGDVLLRNPEVFERWKEIGLEYMFLGLEAIDEEGLERFRKRTTVDKNFEALDKARELEIVTAINIIADPDWDEKRFEVIRKWALSIPEIVNISVATPYPGTELWLTEQRRLTTRDYRLFDIAHAVLPTKLPLARFYEELVKTQQVLNQKFLGLAALRQVGAIAFGHLLRGQTNFLKMIWKFGSVYDPKRQLADHSRPVRYEMAAPPAARPDIDPKSLYIHASKGRRGRSIDDETEAFVDETRMGHAAT